MEPTFNIDMTFDELAALHKTLGIAIDNLSIKASQRGPDSKHGKAALAELSLLASIQRQVLNIISN
jgi:hypothetical protein